MYDGIGNTIVQLLHAAIFLFFFAIGSLISLGLVLFGITYWWAMVGGPVIGGLIGLIVNLKYFRSN